MNYQNVLCAGDSLTAGARSYGCYPLFLAKNLTERTPYEWRAISLSSNGYTARDLWFRLNNHIDKIKDVYLACVLIGTNDVSENNDVELFEEYYRQILRMFFIKSFRVVLCGEIPPIYPDGHVFFLQETIERRKIFNDRIINLIKEFPKANLIKFDDLNRNCYEDSVHFNEKANIIVAESFCKGIIEL